MKSFFVIITALSMSLLHAQENVGIGTVSPNASAMLEIRSTNKGILIPRVNLLSELDMSTISGPSISLLVYNTNNGLPDGDGFYFWNGTKWNKLATRINLANLAWNVSGNANTNGNTDFVGTTDNKPLVFKTNNILSGKIDPGPNNVFLGQSAGIARTTANNNTFLGHEAGASDSSGSNNLFAGHSAGNLNRTGERNVFLGQDAGKNNTIGNFNVYVGEDAGFSNMQGDENVFLGNGAGRNRIGSKNIAIGFNAFANGYPFARYNIAIGHGAGYNAGDTYILPGGGGIYIGTGAGYNAIGGIAIGDSSCKNCEATELNSNVAIGKKTLLKTSTGIANVAVGTYTMLSNTNGQENTAIGRSALYENTTGDYNVALGYHALYWNETGDYNTALGYNAGPLTPSSGLVNTTCIGNNARVTTSNTMAFGNDNVTRWAFGISTTTGSHALEVGFNSTNGNGAYLTQGGTWTNTCDFNRKENFSSLNESDLLHKISQLNIQRWKYKGTHEYHIGPTAQEFHKLFNVGVDDKGISTVDASGIALAAIQTLIKENERLKIELKEIRQLMTQIKESK